MKLINENLTVEDTQINALDFLSRHIDLSRQKLKSAMQNGCVWQQSQGKPQRLRRAKKILTKGDKLYLYYDSDIQHSPRIEPILIQDFTDYSVWYKPYGVYSQGSKWGDHCTIHRWIEKNTSPQKPALIVHRLDKSASGLMLIAHTKTRARQLSDLFAQQHIHKIYHVIVAGKFPNEPQSYQQPIADKSASTEAVLLAYGSNSHQSLLKVRIHSGRKHQIRIHLSQAGFPVIGDRLHGNATRNEVNLQLVSTELRFECPNKQVQQIIQIPTHLLPRLPAD